MACGLWPSRCSGFSADFGTRRANNRRDHSAPAYGVGFLGREIAKRQTARYRATHIRIERRLDRRSLKSAHPAFPGWLKVSKTLDRFFEGEPRALDDFPCRCRPWWQRTDSRSCLRHQAIERWLGDSLRCTHPPMQMAPKTKSGRLQLRLFSIGASPRPHGLSHLALRGSKSPGVMKRATARSRRLRTGPLVPYSFSS